MQQPLEEIKTIRTKRERVLRIAAYPDAEVRNHQVTLAYWEMSNQIDAVLHCKLPNGHNPQTRRNANWFTFATWAVVTVGRNIRTRQLPRRVDQMLPNSIRAQAEPRLLSMRSSDGRRVARALGQGQTIVFITTMMKGIDFLEKSAKSMLEQCVVYLAEKRKAAAEDPEASLAAKEQQDQDDENNGEENGPSQTAQQTFAKADPHQHNPLLLLTDRQVRYIEKRLRPVSGYVDGLDEYLREQGEVLSGGGHIKFDDIIDKLDSFLKNLDREPKALVIDHDLLTRIAALSPGKVADQLHRDLRANRGVSRENLLAMLSESFTEKERTHLSDLDAAFVAYTRARDSDLEGPLKPGEGDPLEVAQEIYRGTLMISAVEQVLLDTAVTTVVNHVPKEFERWFEGGTSVWLERTFQVPRSLGRLGVNRRMRRTQEALRESWARVLTDQVLVLALPTETIRIGRDIPLRNFDGYFYPDDLTCLPEEPPEDEALVPESTADPHSTSQLFDLFDRSQGDGRRTGAWDWRRFDERMNFAANLIRSRQQDPTLFWQPYNDEDRGRIAAGCVPIRTSDPYEQLVVTPGVEGAL